MKTTKATKATITLGAIELDCYQMPDGTYGYGYGWLSQYLGIDKQLLSNKKSPFYLYNHLKSIDKAGLSRRSILVEGISNAKLNWLSTEELMQTLASLAKITPKVLDLIVACAIEALERRADFAFSVQRSEDERNQFIKTRLLGKEKRRTLTDAIKSWIDSHPDQASENYKKFVYSNCTDHLNLVVLGMRAKQVRVELDLNPCELLRDQVCEKALNELATVEEIACRVIEHEDLEPLQAVKKATKIHHTKTIGIR